MNIVEEIKEIVSKLNKIDNYNTTLPQKLSVLDEKEQDLLHYIENNKIGTFASYRIIKELKQNRLERRKIKQDIELAKTFDENKNKLPSKNNRQSLIQSICDKEKQLHTHIEYKNRQYSNEELQELAK